ncbi:4-coumarate--CoA ligase-like isoform X1 [Tribolium madens]|uniref:4-coumarate--CoA ligase-like isoform X1 n=2 Tax=Tribolium madens TaxID=41895 RepID=UPI001CF7398C|nr:4-coumarate--CoA ligase-like isoform X1 [Tribolium madens]
MKTLKMYIRRATCKIYKMCRYKSAFTTLTKLNEKNIIKSKSTDILIPNQLIHEYVWEHLDKWYDKTAVICFNTTKSYTFGEIYNKSLALAGVLHNKFQLNRGDIVAVVLPNVPDFPIVFLGTIQAGLVVTTVNPYYTPDEMAVQLADSDSKLIFTIRELMPVINKCTKILGRKIPTVLAEIKPSDSMPVDCIKLSKLCDIRNSSISDFLNPDDVALLPYSSGTTGLSKGVQLTHKNVVSNLYQMSSPDFLVNLETKSNFQDVIPVFLPLFHIYGMVGIFLNFFAKGCKLIMVPTFVGPQFIKILQLYQPTLLFAVPQMIVTILNNPKIKYDNLKSIRTIISAAAPLGALAVDEFNKKCKNQINLIQMYGMTETSPLTLMQTTKLKNGTKIGGSGFVIPNTEAKIISLTDDSTALGPNQSGELVVKGPQNMKGYHNNPTATKKTIQNNWLRTGDVSYYDEDQHFFITDRLKELIKVKGFQVAPAEIEEILKSHPSVEDAAVVGIPHPVQGEAPKAFVVLRQEVKPEHLREFVAGKVANYKRLVGGVVVLKKIPRNCAGKVLRSELRKL